MNRFLLFTIIIICLLASFGATPAYTQARERCFAETGYCISGTLLSFWERHGGLPVFGMPISPQRLEEVEGQMLQVQWFERTRLELHPQGVLLGRVGVAVLEQQNRNWYTFQKSAPRAGCRFFAETGHNVCDPILTTWRSYGLELDGLPGKSTAENLALFGLPVSDARMETLSNGRQYLVQWFERARFEVHPDGVLLGLLGTELLAPAAETTTPQPFAIEYTGCPFISLGIGQFECGYFSVPEDRSNPDSRLIRLAFTIARQHNVAPAADPIVYLSGGPGGSSLNNAPLLFEIFSPFLGNRELIIFDQRGVGASEPALQCPEYNQFFDDTLDQQLEPAASIQAEIETLQRCRDRLIREGVNLAAYTSVASAADLHDLRQALGYEQWNLFGISYGTRLALTTMRDYPAGIRSVVLDSTYPLQVNLFTDLPTNMDRAFTTLFQSCAANPVCNPAYPDLETTFYNLINRLEANPVMLSVAHPTEGGTVPVLLDGDRFVSLLFQMMYQREILPMLPRMISDTSNGNYVLASLLLPFYITVLDNISAGMYYSVQCSEEVPFTPPDGLRSSAAAYPRLQFYFDSSLTHSESFRGFCNQWGIQPPAPEENQPVSSNLPTLVLAGKFDPITPPAWGQLAAQTLGSSYVYTFPNAGHGVSTDGGCAASIVKAFLDVPTTPPDPSCIERLGDPGFVVLPF